MTFKQEFNSNMAVKLIFALVVVAWSTSWIMIKFQIEHINQGFSVSYRFFGASIILFSIAKFFNFRLSFTRKQHRLMFLQGINLFFFNHMFFYSAVKYISSGIVATSAAMSVIMIPVIDYILHKTEVSSKVFLGGLMGILGVLMIASSELSTDISGSNLTIGLFLCLFGVLTFSLGSVIAKELELSNIKTLISSSAYSMLYGSVSCFLITFAINGEPGFSLSFSFISSLIYLILFPGIFGYLAILYLVDRIGSAKASYTALIYPVLALIISGFFEGYKFTIFSAIGIIFVIFGNFIALRVKKEKNKDIKNVI